MKYNYLSHYLTTLLSKGELIFSKATALKVLGKTDAAIRNSIKRKVAVREIILLLRGYYLIVPVEYKQLGFVPPELFIDDLMKATDTPYYIGLLSAASFYGATHQAIQIFQVMVSKPMKPLALGNIRIIFYFNKELVKVPTQNLKTDRGPLVLSTPEATALDLLRYVHQSGNLNHVATILAEMAEKMNARALQEAALNFPLVYAQRLGYLLDYMGYEQLTGALAMYVKTQKPILFPLLRPGKKVVQAKKNTKWRLIINETVEPDE